MCRYDVEPTRWSRHVNDQAIVIGWAGYDAKVRWLPPEHFLALEFRDALWEACCGGRAGALQGPDGKLIVRLREDDDGFALEHVLVTLEHPEALSVIALDRGRGLRCCRAATTRLRAADRRWAARWREVELLVNPNGPLLGRAAADKDNGQTGRKLVMDYYGPRVPIGGGAIYGKHPTHVDRFGARVARELAIDAVKRGAGECLVRAVYAPNVAEPLDVQVEVARGNEVMSKSIVSTSSNAQFKSFAIDSRHGRQRNSRHHPANGTFPRVDCALDLYGYNEATARQ